MYEEKYDPALLRALSAGGDEPLDIFVHFTHEVSPSESEALAKAGGITVRPGKTLATGRTNATLVRALSANPVVRYVSLARRVNMRSEP